MGFSKNGKSIYQIEKDSSRGYMCAIKDAAAIRDYHELDYSGAEDPQAFEKELGKIEREHASVLKEVIESGIKSRETHVKLIEFVSLMRFRVPAYKTFFDESLSQLVRSAGKIMERQGHFPPPPKGYEDVLRMDQLKITISNWKCLEKMFDLAANPEYIETLLSMRPSILCAPEGSQFFTCDQPVAIYHPETSPGDPYGVGPADLLSEISLPLSSQILLHLTRGPNIPGNRLLTSEEVDEYNRRTIIMADSYVFASELSDYAGSPVERFKNFSAGIDLQVLPVDTGDFHIFRCRPVMKEKHY